MIIILGNREVIGAYLGFAVVKNIIVISNKVKVFGRVIYFKKVNITINGGWFEYNTDLEREAIFTQKELMYVTNLNIT